MKLNTLLGAAAACALIAGAAHAGADMTAKSTEAAPATEASVDAATSAPAANVDASGAATTDPAAPATEQMSTDATASPDASAGVSATSATTYAQGASVTTTTLTNGPVPDTAENRARYGKPLSLAGRRTAAKGN